ncbi:MAG: NHLP leader peptide family natural product precursor [Desulfobacteraceae bacterium]|nr:MAG: NHLP leader peptide family natural product precursor [Desulfobacteraceae bacterium]
MEKEDQKKNFGKVVAKTWADEGYKQRLKSDPAAVLKEEGVEIPHGVEVRVVENTEKVFHMVLPHKPASDGLTDEQLDGLAGGSSVPLISGDGTGGFF